MTDEIKATYELLIRTFIRSTAPTERDQELSLCIQEMINNIGSENDEVKESIREVLGTAKSIIIDIADKAEAVQ